MWRWSFSGVRELRDNFKPCLALQQLNRGLILEWEAEKKNTHLIELDVKKQLVVSILHSSGELRLYNLV